MSLLSKSETHYIEDQKQVSRSYEYKLKPIIKKKVANLLDKEVPLLSSLFPNLDLTEFGKGKSPLRALLIVGWPSGSSMASLDTFLFSVLPGLRSMS